MAHSQGDALRILFIKRALTYPRATGHDIRCFEMLRAFHQLGHRVALATVASSEHQSLEEIGIPCFTLQHRSGDGQYTKTALTYWQERFRTYWGISEDVIRAVPRVADEFEADVVVGLGLDILSHLANAGNRVKVWYAADEFIVHHLSQVKLPDPRTYSSLFNAAIMGLYERSFASVLDRVWVVSASEQRPMQRLAGVRHVDVIANGVDTEYFAPSESESVANSAVFWGRLDFGPNLQALDWFCERIWPEVRRRVPDGPSHCHGVQCWTPGARPGRLARYSARLRRSGYSLHRRRKSNRDPADDLRRRHQEQAARSGGYG